MAATGSAPAQRPRPLPRLATIALAAAISVACLVAQWDIDGNRRVDLRAYWRAVLSGTHGRLYDFGNDEFRFLYPPFAALVLRPLVWLDETTAAHAWLIVSILAGLGALAALLAASGVTDRPDGRPDAARALLFAATALWTAPALETFRLGQINALVTALICVDLVAVTRRHRAAGIATGIAAALKLTPLALVVALALLPRTRTAGRRALASFTAAALIGVAAAPHDSWRFWTDIVIGTGSRGLGRVDNAGILGLVSQVAVDPTMRQILWVLLSAPLVIVAGSRLWHHRGEDVVGTFVVVTNLAAVVSPVTWTHHHWFAVGALALWWRRGRSVADRAVVALGAAGVSGVLDTVAPVGTPAALVALGVLTAVALPAPADFPRTTPVADNEVLPTEERVSHV